MEDKLKKEKKKEYNKRYQEKLKNKLENVSNVSTETADDIIDKKINDKLFFETTTTEDDNDGKDEGDRHIDSIADMFKSTIIQGAKFIDKYIEQKTDNVINRARARIKGLFILVITNFLINFLILLILLHDRN